MSANRSSAYGRTMVYMGSNDSTVSVPSALRIPAVKPAWSATYSRRPALPALIPGAYGGGGPHLSVVSLRSTPCALVSSSNCEICCRRRRPEPSVAWGGVPGGGGACCGDSMHGLLKRAYSTRPAV